MYTVYTFCDRLLPALTFTCFCGLLFACAMDDIVFAGVVTLSKDTLKYKYPGSTNLKMLSTNAYNG